MSTTTYTTRGSVRGCCGHKHRSIETAQKCVMADEAGCRRQGGYSDRSVVRSDGEEMTRAEEQELEAFLCWQASHR
jgi:hypothetical protein